MDATSDRKIASWVSTSAGQTGGNGGGGRGGAAGGGGGFGGGGQSPRVGG